MGLRKDAIILVPRGHEQLRSEPNVESQCRDCGERIMWCITDKGNKMPVNVKPESKIVVTRGDGGRLFAHHAMAFTPHHATCPHAKERKARG